MEKKIKCLIVDDEPLAIEVMKSHIQKIDSLEIIGDCSDAFEAFDFLQKNEVDLMFLDIHMPEMKGTDLIKSLKNVPQVVLTTAYREYAVEGFDLNVLDYLLKPISFERFLQAIEKYQPPGTKLNGVSLHKNEKKEEYLYLREKNVIHKIPVSEIIYIESFGDYLKLHTSDREVNSRSTISSVEKILPEDEFIRMHRSFIVAINQITSFSPVAVFIGKKEFPIGISYRSKTFDKLDYKNFLNK